MTLHRIYLDHNGSTPVTRPVAAEIGEFVEGCWGNAGAGHPDGAAARAAIDDSRARVAAALGGSEREIIFTSGGTESNNAAIFGAAAADKSRRHIVAGRHEHLSVVRCVEELEARGHPVTWIEPLSSGAVDPAAFEDAIRDDTGLVILMFANNETGILQPVSQVAALARQSGALSFVDAVCGAAKMPIDVGSIGCDVLSVSGHKLHAPKGIGALWVRDGVRLSPFVLGCGQQDGRRSGTENTMGAVAMGAALERYGNPTAEGQVAIRHLRDRLFAGIQELGVGAERNGEGPDLPNTLSVWFPKRPSHAAQVDLGRAGLSVTSQTARPLNWDGSSELVPSHVLLSMGLGSARALESLRFSLGSTTEPQEIEAALGILSAVFDRSHASNQSQPTQSSMTLSDTNAPLTTIQAARAQSKGDSSCSLDKLTEQLSEILCTEGRELPKDVGPRVAALLRSYASEEESWRPYVNYREDTYCRNLIWRCEEFELLLLCWEEGQESPIHDHAGQQCWMAVLEGELEEVHYQAGDHQEAAHADSTGPLRPGRATAFPAGGVAYIHDDIALHLIRPKAGGRGASLHLYSSPIDACTKFCPETGQPDEVRVGYHTVRGTDCAGTDPEQIRAAWRD